MNCTREGKRKTVQLQRREEVKSNNYTYSLTPRKLNGNIQIIDDSKEYPQSHKPTK